MSLHEIEVDNAITTRFSRMGGWDMRTIKMVGVKIDEMMIGGGN